MKDSGMADKGDSPNRPDPMSQKTMEPIPDLHPTRRKVLQGVADLCHDDTWTTSSQVREAVGISQQLLNRHLRALESDGLVSLEKPGPGRPLNAAITGTGLRALGLSGPQPEGESQTLPAAPPEQSHDQAPQAATEQQRPRIRLAKRVYLFLERLFVALTPFMKGVGRSDFYQAAGPAMNLRPVKTALYQALQPYLEGVGPVEFEHIVTRLSGVQEQTQPRPQSQTLVSGQSPLRLNLTEAALEDRLLGSMNPAYQGMTWHQRTRLMSDEWDRTRRRRLGLFRTMFSSFDPRWQRPDWVDFNQARRQADYCGAYYAEWVAAQFEKLSPDGQTEVLPNELHGKRALTAYQEYSQT
jgi:DNA-binding transcriptional ArsR family regulator